MDEDQISMAFSWEKKLRYTRTIDCRLIMNNLLLLAARMMHRMGLVSHRTYVIDVVFR